MSNRNKTTRAVLRLMHLLACFPIEAFVHPPAHDNDAFVLPIQAVVPAVALTRVRMCRRDPGRPDG